MILNRVVVDEADRNEAHLRHLQQTVLKPSSDAAASDYQRRGADQALPESTATEPPEAQAPEANARCARQPEELNLSARNPGAGLVSEHDRHQRSHRRGADDV